MVKPFAYRTWPRSGGRPRGAPHPNGDALSRLYAACVAAAAAANAIAAAAAVQHAATAAVSAVAAAASPTLAVSSPPNDQPSATGGEGGSNTWPDACSYCKSQVVYQSIRVSSWIDKRDNNCGKELR